MDFVYQNQSPFLIVSPREEHALTAFFSRIYESLGSNPKKFEIHPKVSELLDNDFPEVAFSTWQTWQTKNQPSFIFLKPFEPLYLKISDYFLHMYPDKLLDLNLKTTGCISKSWPIRDFEGLSSTIVNVDDRQVFAFTFDGENFVKVFYELTSKISFLGNSLLYEGFVSNNVSVVSSLPDEQQLYSVGCLAVMCFIKKKALILTPMLVDLESKKILLLVSTSLARYLQLEGISLRNPQDNGPTAEFANYLSATMRMFENKNKISASEQISVENLLAFTDTQLDPGSLEKIDFGARISRIYLLDVLYLVLTQDLCLAQSFIEGHKNTTQCEAESFFLEKLSLFNARDERDRVAMATSWVNEESRRVKINGTGDLERHLRRVMDHQEFHGLRGSLRLKLVPVEKADD